MHWILYRLQQCKRWVYFYLSYFFTMPANFKSEGIIHQKVSMFSNANSYSALRIDLKRKIP